MPENVVDCQRLPCPQPVILTKKLLETKAPEELTVIVDNEPALENVCRFLASRGYAPSHTAEGGLWRVSARRTETPCPLPDEPAPAARQTGGPAGATVRTLVLASAPVFGSGDDGLGARLMKNFLATLPEMGPELWRLVFVNGGVALCAEGSPVLEDIRRLEGSGVSVLVCGTCLEHYRLLDKKAVGETTNMLDIVTSLQLADKVLRV